jgi:hypothetical protein
MTWVILVFNGLMLVWLVTGVTASSDSCSKVAQTSTDACRAGTAIGVGLILFVAAAGNVTLGVIWLVTNDRKARQPLPDPIDSEATGTKARVSRQGDSGGLASELETLAGLHAGGDLSDQEFAAAKQRLLGGASS